MAKSAKANTVFDVKSIIGDKNTKKQNNTHKEYTQNINTNNAFNIEVQKKETKSKRVNLLLQPSLYEKATTVAQANGISFNELVTQLLQQVIEPPKEVYDGTFRPDGEFRGQMNIDEIE